MKVTFNYGIKTYSGTLDEMTYGAFRNGNLCIGRRYVFPTLTDQNTEMGTIGKNLAGIFSKATEDYKEDLRVYAMRNAKQNVKKNKLAPSAYALFIKMMFAWAKENPSTVDLKTIDIEDIRSTTAPVKRIADAIDNLYLKKVRDYDELINEM